MYAKAGPHTMNSVLNLPRLKDQAKIVEGKVKLNIKLPTIQRSSTLKHIHMTKG